MKDEPKCFYLQKKRKKESKRCWLLLTLSLSGLSGSGWEAICCGRKRIEKTREKEKRVGGPVQLWRRRRDSA